MYIYICIYIYKYIYIHGKYYMEQNQHVPTQPASNYLFQLCPAFFVSPSSGMGHTWLPFRWSPFLRAPVETSNYILLR